MPQSLATFLCVFSQSDINLCRHSQHIFVLLKQRLDHILQIGLHLFPGDSRLPAGGPFRPDDAAYLTAFDELMRYTNLVILDLKEIDPAKHRSLTGRSNENILAMARHVADLGVPLWVRHVLVPGLTDDEEGLRRTGAFIASLPTVQRVEVLPYHTLGLYKWQKLGIPYTLADAVPPTDAEVRRAEELLGVSRYPG